MSQGQDKAEILQFSPQAENRDQRARLSFCQQFLDGMTGYVKPKGNTKKDERDGSTQPDKAMLRSKETILSVKRAGTNRKKVRPIVEGALGGLLSCKKRAD